MAAGTCSPCWLVGFWALDLSPGFDEAQTGSAGSEQVLYQLDSLGNVTREEVLNSTALGGSASLLCRAASSGRLVVVDGSSALVMVRSTRYRRNVTEWWAGRRARAMAFIRMQRCLRHRHSLRTPTPRSRRSICHRPRHLDLFGGVRAGTEERQRRPGVCSIHSRHKAGDTVCAGRSCGFLAYSCHSERASRKASASR